MRGTGDKEIEALKREMKCLQACDVIDRLAATNRLALHGREDSLLDADMPAQKLRLHMGELTADELLVARSAIRWANKTAKSADDWFIADINRLQEINNHILNGGELADTLKDLREANDFVEDMVGILRQARSVLRCKQTKILIDDILSRYEQRGKK